MGIKSTTDKLLKGDISGAVSDVKYTIERTLGLNGVVIVTVAASIGSGLFVLPSFAAAVMGPGIWLAFLLAGIVFLPGTLSKSELASAMPENGGAYVYVERSFGPLVGTISGLGLWASFLLKSAFALIGFSAYMYVLTNYYDVSTNSTNFSFLSNRYTIKEFFLYNIKYKYVLFLSEIFGRIRLRFRTSHRDRDSP